jgi:hypothetical protein
MGWVLYVEKEANIMSDNDMQLDNFLLYYGRIMKELDALKEKAENHFDVNPDDIDSSALYKVRRTVEVLRYANRFWEGNKNDDV